MTEQITAQFTSQYDHSLEAGDAAADAMASARIRNAHKAYTWITFGMVAVGFAALFLVVFDHSQNIRYFYATLVGIALSYGLAHFGGRSGTCAYAEFLATDFGKLTNVTITPERFTLTSTHTRWAIGWGDVLKTYETTNTIGIVHPTGPIFIPKSALDDPAAAYADLKRWHAAGQST